MKQRFLIVGSGGREAAFAMKLGQETILHAVVSHPNPSIINCVQTSGGSYLVADETSPQTVVDFAQSASIDYAFVNADAPLANGVVDALIDADIKTVGGTRAAARIEWDKIYSIEMMHSVAPEHTPYFRVAEKASEIDAAISTFKEKQLQIAVKPQGLTGGKGVKIMPHHLPTYADCAQYAKELLTARSNEKVLFVERLNGIEFTIMGFTDGEHLVLAPASYDYPFRFEDDTGPGTGGMGCFTNSEKKLPFMTNDDLESCRRIMQRIINEMRQRNLSFTGVLNGGFFKTAQGIKFMEFNSRFGDPEGLNILTIMQSSFADLLRHLWHGNLSESSVQFIPQASVIKYLVAAEYPNISDEALLFTVNETCARKLGVSLFFASCLKQNEQEYKTLKKSRVLALGATAERIEAAAEKVNLAIDKCVAGQLEFRADIGSSKSLRKLDQTAATLLPPTT